jgi:hypothetical protein
VIRAAIDGIFCRVIFLTTSLSCASRHVNSKICCRLGVSANGFDKRREETSRIESCIDYIICAEDGIDALSGSVA